MYSVVKTVKRYSTSVIKLLAYKVFHEEISA